jgi:hypothetical protein
VLKLFRQRRCSILGIGRILLKLHPSSQHLQALA